VFGSCQTGNSPYLVHGQPSPSVSLTSHWVKDVSDCCQFAAQLSIFIVEMLLAERPVRLTISSNLFAFVSELVRRSFGHVVLLVVVAL